MVALPLYDLKAFPVRAGMGITCSCRDDHRPTQPPGASVSPVWRNPLALLLASTVEGIFVIDLQGLCTFINNAGARMLGYESLAGLTGAWCQVGATGQCWRCRFFPPGPINLVLAVGNQVHL